MWFPGKNLISGLRGLGSNIMDKRRDNAGVRDRAMSAPGPAPANSAATGYGADWAAQRDALGMLRASALGQSQGPSLAEMEQRGANRQNLVNQLSLTAMGTGGSLAAQQRMAAGQGAASAMAATDDAAKLRLAEQLAAQQAYAQQANTMAGMSGQAMGQNADLAYQWGMGQRGLDLQALQQRQQNQLGWADRFVGAGLGAAQLGMFSDENLKTDIRDASGEAGDTLAALAPIGYRYKSARHGPTDEETIGIKAQDLQRTPRGRRLVREIPGEGLAVDMPGSLSLLLAHGSDVERRLRAIEGGK